MLWRIRTTLVDRPGILAEIALACGRSDVNILGMQVFPTSPQVTDEFIVSAPDGWGDVQLAKLFEDAGGSQVSATRVGDDSLIDAPTRYLRGVHQVLEDGRDAEEVLRELLETEPPDVADYRGHDVLDLTRRNGSVLRISRAVPFTSVERARAQALLSLVSDAGFDTPLIAPSTRHHVPMVRAGHVGGHRGRVGPARALQRGDALQPLSGAAADADDDPHGSAARRSGVRAWPLVAQVGLDVVGHGLLESVDTVWTFQLLIEDAWQGQGLGTMLVKQAAGRAKSHGAARLTFITEGSNDKLLRTVGNAGFVARVERHDGNVHISVPLSAVRSTAAG